jgi:hypothetical protein
VTRASFIAAVMATALGWPQIVGAETREEQSINDVLEAAVNAQFASDFPRLVSLMHPASQHLFRDILSARFDELLRLYAFDQIVFVSGLPNHPRDLSFSDSDFFVFACNNAKMRHPDFVGDPKYLPFDIHGAVFDNDNLVRVVLSHSGSVHTERTDFNYLRPFTIAFKREQSKWLVWSCPLALQIAHNWSRDLARSKNIEVN